MYHTSDNQDKNESDRILIHLIFSCYSSRIKLLNEKQTPMLVHKKIY